jgi:hypothetical protein
MLAGSAPFSPKLKPDWLSPIILLFVVATILSFFLPITDVRLYDETSYLRAGRDLFVTPLDIETGPLYSIWYWFGGLIVHNNLYLYFASWCTLVAGCLTLPYFIERGRAATIYACIAASLPFYLVWPYVNLFASAIVLTSLSIIESKKEKSYISLCAGLLLMCSIVALVRPEFRYAAYFSVAFLAGAIVLERRAWRHHRSILLASVLGFLIVEFLFSNAPANRSGIAFAAYDNWIRFKQGLFPEPPKTPWTPTYQLFGLTESATLLDFLKANPAEFWAHVLYNVLQIKFIALLALGVVTAVVACIRFASPRHVSINISFDRLIPLTIVYAPAIAATAFIYPQIHYFVIPYLASVFYIAHSEVAALALRSTKMIVTLAAFASLSIFATFLVAVGKASDHRMTAVIKCVTELQSEHEINQGRVLEALGGLSPYLKGTMGWVPHYEIRGKEPFNTFIARIAPVIIISDQEMRDYFVLNENLPSSATRQDMNAIIRDRGYGKFTCNSTTDIFFAKDLISHAGH